MAQSLVPAVQYLRMSTDHQQYSLDNQADAIARYAEAHGFLIVKTFCDEAKSGLSVKRRNGLKQLLGETVDGHAEFKAILVYDVSRWGRFQDADEAAHYEFLCKSAGAPVYYCAEAFSGETGFSATLLKALKRTMAGEYSRELSARVRAGQKRLAMLGYKLGGAAPYGLRRMLLDSSGRPKQVLALGEYKSLVTERVIFVPGPQHETVVVQRIFHEFTEEQQSMHAIARRLNSEGVAYLRGAKWSAATIRRVLRHSAYMGTQVWGRTSSILSRPRTQVPSYQWVTCASAFEPIISKDVFHRAQCVFSSFPHNQTDEEMLERLRGVLNEHGKLSAKIIHGSHVCPSVNTIKSRFGSLNNMYARLGLPTSNSPSTSLRAKRQILRANLIRSILEAFPDQLKVYKRGSRFRALLMYRRTRLLISVLLATCMPRQDGKLRWFFRSPRCERKRPTIVGLLNESNTIIDRLLVFQDIPFRKTKVPADSEWLQSGIPLTRLCDLVDIVHEIRRNTTRPF